MIRSNGNPEISRMVQQERAQKAAKRRRKLREARYRQMGEVKFYDSDRWRLVRYKALKNANGKCQCCGRSGKETVLHVDHIKPRSYFPELAFDLNNLQVLCKDCNLGKSNTDVTDWR